MLLFSLWFYSALATVNVAKNSQGVLAEWEEEGNEMIIPKHVANLVDQIDLLVFATPTITSTSTTSSAPTCPPVSCNCTSDQICRFYRNRETGCFYTVCVEKPCVKCPEKPVCPSPCGPNQSCKVVTPGTCHRCPVYGCVPDPCILCPETSCEPACHDYQKCKILQSRTCYECAVASCYPACRICPQEVPACNCAPGQLCTITTQTCTKCASVTCTDPPPSEPCKYCKDPDFCAVYPDGSRKCVSSCKECPPLGPCGCRNQNQCILVPRTCDTCSQYMCKAGRHFLKHKALLI